MHRCIKCNQLFEDDTVPLFNGCNCGSKFFVFVKDGEEAQELLNVPDHELRSIEEKIDSKKIDLEILIVEAPPEQKKALETAVSAGLPTERKASQQAGKPRGFGIETVRNPKPGVYDINIEALLNGNPVIIFSNGKTYVIHLATAFKGINN